MSLRMPQNLSNTPMSNAALTMLDIEVAAEKALNLGRLAKAMQASLASLAALPTDTPAENRNVLVQSASATVWRFFVQREMCGALDHREAIDLYAIPSEVLAQVGSVR
jgi:hypothetical protein